MGIKSKFTYLNETKDLLKEEISRINVVSDSDTFRSYKDKLHSGYLDILNNGTDTLWNNLEKVSQTGTEATLEGVETAPMKMVLNGNTSQDGEPTPDTPVEVKVVKGENVVSVQGKNLIPNQKNNVTSQGVTFTANEDGTYLISGKNSGVGNSIVTLFSNQNYILEPKTYYTIPTNNEKVTIVLYVTYEDNTNQYININRGIQSSVKINKKVVKANAYLQVAKGTTETYVDYKVYPILTEKPVDVDTYVPYSKTDYPIDLVAENIFDKDDARILRGYINISNKVINTSNNDYSVIVKIKPNTKYIATKMANNPERQARFRLGTTTNYPQMGGAKDNVCNQVISNDTATELSITTESNDNYLVIFCYNLNSTTTLNEMLGSLVVREAEPIYKEMCKIGDYKDYFHKDSGKWYVHKEIGKKIFDGTEYWRAVATNTADIYRMLTTSLKESILTPATSSTQFLAFCSRFKPIIADDTYQKNEGISCARDGNVHIYMEDYNTSTSATDFKTWLSTHNVTLYYVLATPTEEEITDTTLIEQLEAISKAKSVKDKTYITQTNEELPFILDVEAIKEYEVN